MVVTGTAGGAHMWNLVCIDGQWYIRRMLPGTIMGKNRYTDI